jgi:hypothetical protein
MVRCDFVSIATVNAWCLASVALSGSAAWASALAMSKGPLQADGRPASDQLRLPAIAARTGIAAICSSPRFGHTNPRGQ